jgi:glutaredoxin
MDYLLFTYPNCSQCEAVKGYLAEASLEGQECSLVLKESKMKIRDYLGVLKRDDKGGIIIPTLILREEGEVLVVLNSKEELEEWLKSRD